MCIWHAATYRGGHRVIEGVGLGKIFFGLKSGPTREQFLGQKSGLLSGRSLVKQLGLIFA